MTLVNKKDVLVTLADANFINQAKQLFASVYFKAGWAGDYLLLASGISEVDLEWFRNKGILVYDCPLLSETPVGSRSYPPVVLSKFYLFQEYFKQWRKVIFLDADIIVRAPLDSLLQLKGFNAPEATTLRLKDEFISSSKLDEAFKKKYNLASRAFNTGVLVFDTDLITDNTFAEMLSWYHQFQNIVLYNEESVLNLYFYGRWNLLPIVYNSVPWHLKGHYKLQEDNFLAFIIHFICCLKPWEKRSPFYPEWHNNLLKADEIDLNNKLEVLPPFSGDELSRYLRYLKKRDFIFLIIKPWLFINYQIGQLGKIIERKTPKLYKLINLKRFLKSKHE